MGLRRWTIAAAVVATLALVGTSCAPGGIETGDQGSGDITFALTADRASFEYAEPVAMTLTISNFGPESRQVLSFQLPIDGIDADILDVRRDGVPVPYFGKVVKRADPLPEDFIDIAAGASVTFTVDPTEAYDMALPGNYTVRYRAAALSTLSPRQSLLRMARSDAELREVGSDEVTVSYKGGGQPNEKLNKGSGGAPIPYYKCSGDQINSLGLAKSNATIISADARDYFSSASADPVRYTTWFGARTNARADVVYSHFDAINDAFSTQNVIFDCACKKPRYYAYVYPTRPYSIYLCGAFWTYAGETGTDSRPGTLVHEMSHFNVVASTDDLGYGQAFCVDLATTNPDGAITNADSHEYFAEAYWQ